MLERFSVEADLVEQRLAHGTITTTELETLRLEIEARRRSLAPVAESVENELAPLLAQREVLGPAPEDSATESAETARRRIDLNNLIAPLEALQKRIREAEARGRALMNLAIEQRRERFTDQLLTRGRSPLRFDEMTLAAESLVRVWQKIKKETAHRLELRDQVNVLLDRVILPAMLAVVALGVAVGLRRWSVRRLLNAAEAAQTAVRRLALGIGITLARLVMPVLGVMIIMAGLFYSGFIGLTGKTLIEALASALLFVIGAYALSGAYFAPGAASVRLSALENAPARRAHRWLVALMALVGLDRALVENGDKIGLSIEALNVLNAGLLTCAAAALWGFIGASGIGSTPQQQPGAEIAGQADDDADAETGSTLYGIGRAARIIARIAALIAPLLAFAGYFGASRFAIYPVVLSGVVIGLCILLYDVACSLIGIVDRKGSKGRTSNGLQLIPVMFAFLLACAATPALALIWGADYADLHTLWAYVVEGFRVGDVVISPTDFITFVLVFTIGYMLTRSLKSVLRRSVLPLTTLDPGGRSAVLAGVGYLGVFVSVLVAVSTTGLDLSNLAIVAGALSVGIGFGLQTIVNNFVSGIILLIERPIKTGDWVEIGGHHGYVRKVNVRSTEIETFDRSSMFVPNADLISGTVTNWTYSNSHGRLIVPVGVAYGSDMRKVEKLLLEAAQAHPMLLRRPAPYVILTGFGDSSVDFEIRGVLRDVNWVLNVASDIRFDILEKFEAAGIEIPFPQRDLHLKGSFPGSGAKLDDSMSATAPET